MTTIAPEKSEPVPAAGGAQGSERTPSGKSARGPLASLHLTVWLAAAFCGVVCATLLWFHFTATTSDPWKSPQLLALRERLVAEPANEDLKRQIRRLDAEFRQKFRGRLSLDRSGGWLLLAGALALVAAGRTAAGMTKRMEVPAPKPDMEAEAARTSARSRRAVAWAGAAVCAALGVVALAERSAFDESAGNSRSSAASGSGVTNAPVEAPAPTLAEFRANFPRFRGWDGSGWSAETNTPLSWDLKTGAGIAWKTPVLASGHNSPVLWGNRLFITGGTAAVREVFAYDAADGRLLWRQAVGITPGAPAKAPEIFEDTGYAASTAATDGRRVYAIFGNGDLGALSFDGKVAWTKALGPLKNQYGHAASLAIWPGELIVQLDQGETPSGASKLVALDPATGRVLWERSRPVSASWSTPVVCEAAGGAQIVTAGAPWVIAYKAGDGAELWRAELLDGEVVPSPVVAGGLVFAVNPSSKLVALRMDGRGEITKTGVVWSSAENAPDIPSPVGNGELLFAVSGGGELTCFEANDGKKVWSKELKMDVNASPAVLGNRLFILGLKGVALVAEAGRSFKETARSELADKFIASPAFAGGRTFLRGETNLYCIGPAAVSPVRTP